MPLEPTRPSRQRHRPRGFAAWNPDASSLAVVTAVQHVLAEYEAELPLTLRQIFYRLVATAGYEKTELAYERLGDKVNRARRARLVPFESIRDDGSAPILPLGFGTAEDFLEWAREHADELELDRQEGQARYLEVWVEAAGMAPMIGRVARDVYGVPVYPAGGFDSVTFKHDAAVRMRERDRPTTVLHLGDYDPSGVSLFVAVSEDVTALHGGLDDDDDGDEPEFVRLAVLEEHIEEYGLETAPPKKSDKRSVFTDTRTVQAEAFAPDQLQELVRSAIVARFDEDAYQQVLELEKREQSRLGTLLDTLDDNIEGSGKP